MWDLIVLVPDHCLSFYFDVFDGLFCGCDIKARPLTIYMENKCSHGCS